MAKKNGTGNGAPRKRKTVKELAQEALTSETASSSFFNRPIPAGHEELSERKYRLNPPPPPQQEGAPEYEYLGELPDCYGTQRLFLVARDPQFLYAYWDMGWEQYWDAVNSSHDRKVFLQVYLKDGSRVQQLQINEYSRNWYIQTNTPDTTYYAELGFYRHDGGFNVISRSSNVTTPRDNLSWKTDARFVTIPFEWTFKALFELICGHMKDGEELAEALCRLQEEGFPFPFRVGRGRKLSARQQRDLLEFLGLEFTRRIKVGSLEITETLRRRIEELLSSGQWTTSLSSPFGASFGAAKRGFHMHVNAELIIYGGTDPKARVRVDGKEINLRPDGTFSYHFSLPDGKFHIPIDAMSPDGVEIRSALLSFLRMSEYEGDVRKTGQSKKLKEPIGRKA